MFPELSAEEREALKRKYGTLAAILEAEDVIGRRRGTCCATTWSLLPNGLKAQVVAISRRAAVRYQAAFAAARDELVAEPRARHGHPRAGRPRPRGETEEAPAAVRAARQLDGPAQARVRGDDLPR